MNECKPLDMGGQEPKADADQDDGPEEKHDGPEKEDDADKDDYEPEPEEKDDGPEEKDDGPAKPRRGKLQRKGDKKMTSPDPSAEAAVSPTPPSKRGKAKVKVGRCRLTPVLNPG
jgi:hypothetical protein